MLDIVSCSVFTFHSNPQSYICIVMGTFQFLWQQYTLYTTLCMMKTIMKYHIRNGSVFLLLINSLRIPPSFIKNVTFTNSEYSGFYSHFHLWRNFLNFIQDRTFRKSLCIACSIHTWLLCSSSLKSNARKRWVSSVRPTTHSAQQNACSACRFWTGLNQGSAAVNGLF